MCQPLVHARLAKVVGDVIETPVVRDFGTSEDFGCSISERTKGLKDRDTWKDYETLEILRGWSIGTRSVEGSDTPVPVPVYTVLPRVGGDHSGVNEFVTPEDYSVVSKVI
jgi:hypothetical protein